MGNCLRRQPSTHCGDRRGSPAPVASRGHFISSNTRHDEMEEQLESSSSSTKKSSTTEVKIKITKKQLEELLGRADLKELPVQQVLAQLMNLSSNEFHETHPRSWRPNLQSIPE